MGPWLAVAARKLQAAWMARIGWQAPACAQGNLSPVFKGYRLEKVLAILVSIDSMSLVKSPGDTVVASSGGWLMFVRFEDVQPCHACCLVR